VAEQDQNGPPRHGAWPGPGEPTDPQRDDHQAGPRSPGARSAENPQSADESFRPILSEQVLRRFSALSSRPNVSARVALVVIGAKGTPRVFGPQQRPTVGELVWGGAGTLYEVDMGLHHTRVEIELPSNGDTFAFHAVASIQWRVADPIRVVQDAVRDVRETLSAPLQQRLGDITRRFSARAVANAEEAATAALRSAEVGFAYGLTTTIFLRLTMNQTSVAQITSLDDVNYQIELEQRTQELRELKEQHNEALLKSRVRSYRDFINAGDVNQFALQLAQNPNDVAAVVQLVREERHENRRHATDFVTRLLDSGVIEKWEIDDQARAALELLKESTQRVIRPPEAAAVPQPSDGDVLPTPDLVKPELPGHPEPPASSPGPTP